MSRVRGLPRWLSGKESASQSRRRRFDPWVRKIPWRRRQATHSSILAWESQWTEEVAGYSPWDHKESEMTEWQRENRKQKFRVMKNYWGVLGTVCSLKLPINRERVGEREEWRNAGRWQGRQRPDPAGCALC